LCWYIPDSKPFLGFQVRSVLISEQGVGPNVKALMKVYVPLTSQPAGQVRPQTTRGLLLGPSGSTLRALTAESRCTIKLRGRGSGTDAKSANPADEIGEELHAAVEYEGPAAGRDTVS
jgi:hypothetical protein